MSVADSNEHVTSNPLPFLPHPPLYKKAPTSGSILNKSRRPPSGRSVTFDSNTPTTTKSPIISNGGTTPPPHHIVQSQSDSSQSQIGGHEDENDKVLENKGEKAENPQDTNLTDDLDLPISDNQGLCTETPKETSQGDPDCESVAESSGSGRISKISNFEESIPDTSKNNKEKSCSGQVYFSKYSHASLPEVNKGDKNIEEDADGLSKDKGNRTSEEEKYVVEKTENTKTMETVTEKYELNQEQSEKESLQSENSGQSRERKVDANTFQTQVEITPHREIIADSSPAKVKDGRHVTRDIDNRRRQMISLRQSTLSVEPVTPVQNEFEPLEPTEDNRFAKYQNKDQESEIHREITEEINISSEENNPSDSRDDWAFIYNMIRRRRTIKKKKRRIYTTDIYETDGQMSSGGYMEKLGGDAAERRKLRSQDLKRRLSLTPVSQSHGTDQDKIYENVNASNVDDGKGIVTDSVTPQKSPVKDQTSSAGSENATTSQTGTAKDQTVIGRQENDTEPQTSPAIDQTMTARDENKTTPETSPSIDQTMTTRDENKTTPQTTPAIDQTMIARDENKTTPQTSPAIDQTMTTRDENKTTPQTTPEKDENRATESKNAISPQTSPSKDQTRKDGNAIKTSPQTNAEKDQTRISEEENTTSQQSSISKDHIQKAETENGETVSDSGHESNETDLAQQEVEKEPVENTDGHYGKGPDSSTAKAPPGITMSTNDTQQQISSNKEMGTVDKDGDKKFNKDGKNCDEVVYDQTSFGSGSHPEKSDKGEGKDSNQQKQKESPVRNCDFDKDNPEILKDQSESDSKMDKGYIRKDYESQDAGDDELMENIAEGKESRLSSTVTPHHKQDGRIEQDKGDVGLTEGSGGVKSINGRHKSTGEKENTDGNMKDKIQNTHHLIEGHTSVSDARSVPDGVLSYKEMSSSEVDSSRQERKSKQKSKRKHTRQKLKMSHTKDEPESSSGMETNDELTNYKKKNLKELCRELRMVRRAISEIYEESKRRDKRKHSTKKFDNEPSDKCHHGSSGNKEVVVLSIEKCVKENNDGKVVEPVHDTIQAKESRKEEDKDVGVEQRSQYANFKSKEEEKTGDVVHMVEQSNMFDVDPYQGQKTEEVKVESILRENKKTSPDDEVEDENIQQIRSESNETSPGDKGTTPCESSSPKETDRNLSSANRDLEDFVSDLDSTVGKDEEFPELRSTTSDEAHSVAQRIMEDILDRTCDILENRTYKKELTIRHDDQDDTLCIIYCDKKTEKVMTFVNSLTCKEESLACIPNMVPKYGALLSPVLSLYSPDGNSPPQKLTVRIPFMKASMQHHQHPLLRQLGGENTWCDVDSSEHMYEDQDGCIIPVIEADIETLAPMAVVASPIIEHFVFDGNVREVCSYVDPGILITSAFSPRFNSVETIVNLTVLPIPNDVVEDSRRSQVEDAHLLASATSVIKVDLLNDPPQPVTLYLPCNKPKSRPWTAQMTSRLSTDSGYLTTSRIKSRAKSREAIKKFLEAWYEAEMYLVRVANGNTALKETRLKNKDVNSDDKVVLTCHEKISTFLIIETKKEAQHPNVLSIANSLMSTLETQRVLLCVLQNKDDLKSITVTCELKSRLTSRLQIRYERDHFIKRAIFSVKEGELIKLSTRGNVANIPNETLVTRFYAIHGLKVNWKVAVVDSYSQRSLSSYCGFVQILTRAADDQAAVNDVNIDDDGAWSRLVDVAITLPKYKIVIPTSLTRVPIHLRNEGPISVEFLLSLAKYIGHEWYHLSRALRIDHARVQSIVQQNRHQSTEKLVADLLITWMKRSTHGTDKAQTLVKALRRCGRSDLADEIKDIDRSYKRDLHRTAYEKHLNRAIQTTISSPIVVRHWRQLSHVLGVREKTVASISSSVYDDKRKCQAMLSEWRNSRPHRAQKKLIGSLRRVGCNCVADHLVSSLVFRPKTSL